MGLECQRGSKKNPSKQSALTPPRPSACHLKRHQAGSDKLTQGASGSCLTTRQPCHLILLRHCIQGTVGIKPGVNFSRQEKALKTALHDETTPCDNRCRLVRRLTLLDEKPLTSVEGFFFFLWLLLSHHLFVWRRVTGVPTHLVNAVMMLTERFNCEGARAQSIFRYYGNVTEQKGQNHAYSRSYISILKLNPSQSTKANVE